MLLGERSDPYSTGTRQNDFVFFYRPWNPSAFHFFKCIFLGTCGSDLSNFCINTTTGSRSIKFEIFGPPKICRRVISDKIVNLRIFSGGKVYFSEFCLHMKLINANIFALIDGPLFSWAAFCAIFFKIFFRLVLVKNREEIIEFLRNRFYNTHCQLDFLILTPILYKLISRSACLSLSCTGNIVIDRCQNFRRPKLFRRRVFGENKRK